MGGDKFGKKPLVLDTFTNSELIVLIFGFFYHTHLDAATGDYEGGIEPMSDEGPQNTLWRRVLSLSLQRTD